MDRIYFILTILFLTMYSSFSFANWTYVGKNTSGSTFYVDFNSIKINNQDYVFYWGITNYPKLSPQVDLSSKVIYMLDCTLLRDKIMGDYYYKKLNAKGDPTSSSTEPDKEWVYSQPGSIQEKISKKVCNYLGK